jgi:hypothetical protein
MANGEGMDFLLCFDPYGSTFDPSARIVGAISGLTTTLIVSAKVSFITFGQEAGGLSSFVWQELEKAETRHDTKCRGGTRCLLLVAGYCTTI